MDRPHGQILICTWVPYKWIMKRVVLSDGLDFVRGSDTDGSRGASNPEANVPRDVLETSRQASETVYVRNGN